MDRSAGEATGQFIFVDCSAQSPSLSAIALAASLAHAQVSLVSAPYPANNSSITLSSGTVVRQRNLVVFRGNGGTSLTITIETPTPATDSDQVAREAHEVAVFHDEFARTRGITTIAVAVCRTQACLELRELSNERFVFAHAGDGRWVTTHR